MAAPPQNALSVEDLIKQTMSLLGPGDGGVKTATGLSSAGAAPRALQETAPTELALAEQPPVANADSSSSDDGDLSDYLDDAARDGPDGPDSENHVSAKDIALAQAAMAQAADIVSPASPETDDSPPPRLSTVVAANTNINIASENIAATAHHPTTSPVLSGTSSAVLDQDGENAHLHPQQHQQHQITNATPTSSSALEPIASPISTPRRAVRPSSDDTASGATPQSSSSKTTRHAIPASAPPKTTRTPDSQEVGNNTDTPSPSRAIYSQLGSGGGSKFGTKESMRSAHLQKSRADGARNEMAERARLRMLKKKHEALLLAVETERQAKEEAESDKRRQKRRKAALRKDRAERQRRLADRHAKAIAEAEAKRDCGGDSDRGGSESGRKKKVGGRKRRSKEAASEADGDRSQSTTAERKTRRKEARRKKREEAARGAAKEAAKAAEAAARAATLATMSSTRGSSSGASGFGFSLDPSYGKNAFGGDNGAGSHGGSGGLDELISNYIAVSSSLRAQLHVTQLRIATRMRVNKDSATDPTVIAAHDVISAAREHLEAVDRDLPAVHTHLSEMGLLHTPSIGRKPPVVTRQQHQHHQQGGLQHSQSTPLFHSRGAASSGDASSPWLPRLENNGHGGIGANDSRIRGQKYTNQHTPLQYSPPRQRSDDAKYHAQRGRRATQSARGEGGIRNKPHNVLTGRPVDSHDEDVYYRRRGGDKRIGGSSRHAKSQPGLAESGAGFGSAARRLGGDKSSSRKGTKNSKKSKKSGKSRRKRSQDRQDQKHRRAGPSARSDKDQTADGGRYYDTRAEEEGETAQGGATPTAYQDIDLGSLYANHPSITYIE